MVKIRFQVGDKIRMKETCGKQTEGSILTVQERVAGNYKELYVKKDDEPYIEDGSGLCSCSEVSWEFISHGTIDDWQKYLEV